MLRVISLRKVRGRWQQLFEFVKSHDAVVIVMSDRPKDAKKNKDDEEEENPTNVGPGITESHEEG
jgi:hypothetical protein